jgi:hypothetical protein
MGNLVIHGGSAQNTILTASDKASYYNFATVKLSNEQTAPNIISGKDKAMDDNRLSGNYIVTPNININILFENISWFYVDILTEYSETGETVKLLKQTFLSREELLDLLKTMNVKATCTFIFYMLKNNTDGLSVSGSNFMLTQYTRPYGVSGKISSKSTFRLEDNGSNVTSNLFELFAEDSEKSLYSFGATRIESFSSIVCDARALSRLLEYNAVKIMKYNRYGKRKLSNFNVNFNNETCVDAASGETTTVTTNNSKLLCTFLCKYNYLDSSVEILLVSTPNKNIGDGNSLINTDGNAGYFHVYVFQSNINPDSEQKCISTAIEFLSVDGIQIPAAYDINPNSSSNWENIFYKSKNKLILSEGSDMRARDVNKSIFLSLGNLVGQKAQNHNDATIDVIVPCKDRTCNVYPNALILENVKHSLRSGISKTYFFKLNK